MYPSTIYTRVQVSKQCGAALRIYAFLTCRQEDTNMIISEVQIPPPHLYTRVDKIVLQQSGSTCSQNSGQVSIFLETPRRFRASCTLSPRDAHHTPTPVRHAKTHRNTQKAHTHAETDRNILKTPTKHPQDSQKYTQDTRERDAQAHRLVTQTYNTRTLSLFAASAAP